MFCDSAVCNMYWSWKFAKFHQNSVSLMCGLYQL
uniref:Uncharacterized protein n=1 Tax=Rhizophora mucronata TaxID=61149 RepID=A0A2P2K4H6_RHIMU